MAAISLSAGAVLFAPSSAELGPTPIAHGNVQYEPLPDHSENILAMRHSGEIAIKHSTEAKPPTADQSKLLALLHSAPISEAPPPLPTTKSKRQIVLSRSEHYANQILLPLIEKSSDLKPVTPPDTDAGIVNGPGNFVVAGDTDCAVQYYVHAAGEVNSIEPTVWGDRKLFNGRTFSHAAYSHQPGTPRLQHIEGIESLSFRADDPRWAARFVERTFPYLCHLETAHQAAAASP